MPSTGIALTGNASPRPAMISAVNLCTKSGADGDTVGGLSNVLVAALGIASSLRWAKVWSTAAMFCATTSRPFAGNSFESCP